MSSEVESAATAIEVRALDARPHDPLTVGHGQAQPEARRRRQAASPNVNPRVSGLARKLARLDRIYSVLRGINSLIIKAHERRPLFEGACEIAAAKGGFGIAWIGTVADKAAAVQPIVWAGADSRDLDSMPGTTHGSNPGRPGIVGRAIQDQRPVFCNDLATDPGSGGARREEVLRRGYRSMICLPLRENGALVAVLSLYTRELNFFDDSEVGLLNDLAQNISFALDNIAKEEQLQYLAYYDKLTGLPNRQLFLDRISQQLRGRSGEARMVALILLDIERFRIVNDTLGRNGGDELLRQVARRLESESSGKENLARLGANGFGLKVRGARDAADVAHAVERCLINCFREPYVVDGIEIRLSAKAGIAIFPTDGNDPDTLFRNAEAALKKCKSAGDPYLFYAAEMNARAEQALTMETKLRRAVESREFVLHYQPKIESASGRICGLEALIRWNDPEKGLVPPGHFIPLLEETGLIIEAGEWALNQAAQTYCEWLDQGIEAPRIAVNVSPIQLRQKGFVEMVKKVLERAPRGRNGLDIEITESFIMENTEDNIGKLRTLREMGLDIAIDDFGTGYSSLRYLARLPVNALKIDRSFISAMSDDADSMAIVSTIISLGHSLNMKIVAEGVETDLQSRFLKLLRCDQMQGFLFSKPLPREQIEGLLKAPGSRPVPVPVHRP